MCYEDVKLGYRRFAKIIQTAPAVVTINADSGRVVLRLVIQSTIAAESSCIGAPIGTNLAVPLLFVNAGDPSDEITFETHGELVQRAWSFNCGGNTAIVEIIDRKLNQPPGEGQPHA